MEREMVSSYSSEEEEEEEEEERQTLITQQQQHPFIIHKSPKQQPNLHSSSNIFQIDTDNNNNNNNDVKRFFFNSPQKLKRYLLFAVFPSIFIIIILILVYSSSSSRHDSGDDSLSIVNRMRESELHALYLLKNQQQSLFNLWNNLIPSSSNNNQTTIPSLIPDTIRRLFKSQVLSQISLNKQIQHALLSPHQTNNNNYDSFGGGGLGLDTNSTDPSFFNTNSCGKVDQKLSERRTVEWRPDPGKYLFAICVSGQMSNHLICLEKHMFFAALLNRVLVIPSPKVDYQFDRVLDIDRINTCLGRNVVVTFEEFAEATKTHFRIDRFVCYFSEPQNCFLDDDHVKKIKSLGLTMNKLEPAWEEDVKSPRKRTMDDVVSKFGTKEDVIAIGDVFFADVEREMVMQAGGPIAHKCNTLIEPSRLILLTAQRFVQTFLGERFIALHFRRHGFLKFCNAKTPSCFFPIPQAAECISRLVEKANTPVIYLSTDAAESETSLLQSLIVLNGKTVPLVKRPARNSAEKWDALLYRHGIEGDPQVEAMLDKTISAMSSVFIGASGSTFTEDILRLRKDWGSASLCDEYLCQGEVPNFIADNE